MTPKYEVDQSTRTRKLAILDGGSKLACALIDYNAVVDILFNNTFTVGSILCTTSSGSSQQVTSPRQSICTRTITSEYLFQLRDGRRFASLRNLGVWLLHCHISCQREACPNLSSTALLSTTTTTAQQSMQPTPVPSIKQSIAQVNDVVE